ncbi:hypothetical protein D3C75_963820 [compost metagenome]
MTAASNEEAAFRRTLWGSQGESQGEASRALLGFAVDGGASLSANAGSTLKDHPSGWMQLARRRVLFSQWTTEQRIRADESNRWASKRLYADKVTE